MRQCQSKSSLDNPACFKTCSISGIPLKMAFRGGTDMGVLIPSGISLLNVNGRCLPSNFVQRSRGHRIRCAMRVSGAGTSRHAFGALPNVRVNHSFQFRCSRFQEVKSETVLETDFDKGHHSFQLPSRGQKRVWCSPEVERKKSLCVSVRIPFCFRCPIVDANAYQVIGPIGTTFES